MGYASSCQLQPATIMTDPEFADRTYIEPLTPDSLERIIERESGRDPATVGGQTGSTWPWPSTENGAWSLHGVQLIGAKYEAIPKPRAGSSSKNR